MKGIILAGGTGSRLFPITHGTSKQLLPVYDKPLLYYPLSLLMLAGIREITVITSSERMHALKSVLLFGHQWGVNFHFQCQDKPRGLPEAYLLAEKWLDGDASTLILGDNIYHGHGMPTQLANWCSGTQLAVAGATIFTKPMTESHKYGVLRVGGLIVEKPEGSFNEPVVTGLYVADGRAPTFARALKPSKRGELEIADLLNAYGETGELHEEKLGRGIAWFDAGNPSELLTGVKLLRISFSRGK